MSPISLVGPFPVIPSPCFFCTIVLKTARVGKSRHEIESNSAFSLDNENHSLDSCPHLRRSLEFQIRLVTRSAAGPASAGQAPPKSSSRSIHMATLSDTGSAAQLQELSDDGSEDADF